MICYFLLDSNCRPPEFVCSGQKTIVYTLGLVSCEFDYDIIKSFRVDSEEWFYTISPLYSTGKTIRFLELENPYTIDHIVRRIEGDTFEPICYLIIRPKQIDI